MIDSTQERRRNERLRVRSTAVLLLEGIELGSYAVDNLSPGGALLTGDISALQDDQVTVLLLIHGRPSIEVDGRIMRLDRSVGSTIRMGVAFEHASSATEDALWELLYGESAISEDPQTALPTFDDIGDPDMIPLVPEPA